MDFLKNTEAEIEKLREYIYKPGALDKKTKFLMAISNCVALGCEPCMIYRFRAAKEEFDCTTEEIEEAVSIAIMNGAGVTMAKAKAAWGRSRLEKK